VSGVDRSRAERKRAVFLRKFFSQSDGTGKEAKRKVFLKEFRATFMKGAKCYVKENGTGLEQTGQEGIG